jgi:hypothetical protein
MKKHAAPIIAASLLLLPVLYVGSYFFLVSPNRGPVVRTVYGCSLTPGYDVHADYRVGDLSQLYWPVEQADRRLRPQAWVDPRELELEIDWQFAELTRKRAVLTKVREELEKSSR